MLLPVAAFGGKARHCFADIGARFGHLSGHQSAGGNGRCFRPAELGRMYAHARGVTRNLTEAVKWYRKAAERGEASAQFDLSLCYYSGHGVRRTTLKA